MGIYDTVKYKAPCWKCGEVLTDFQTKDAGLGMDVISPKKLGTGRFYTSCHKCYAWNEYDVIPKEVEIVFNEKESKLKVS